VSDGISKNDNPWAVTLREIDSHESGSFGEDPSGMPNNLMPFIYQVAVGKLKQLKLFGGNYDTVGGQ